MTPNFGPLSGRLIDINQCVTNNVVEEREIVNFQHDFCFLTRVERRESHWEQFDVVGRFHGLAVEASDFILVLSSCSSFKSELVNVCVFSLHCGIWSKKVPLH